MLLPCALLPLALAIAVSGCAHDIAGRGSEEVTVSDPSDPARAPLPPVDQTHDGVSIDPFRAIVRRRVLASFDRLSQGDPSAALALMDERVQYTFEGHHALGGTRVSRAGVERWFGRLLRLLPGRFTIRSVEVVGTLWRATVYTVFEDEVHPAAGAPYRNHGVQLVELRWGKAVRIHTYVDTARITGALDTLAASGFAEAAAPPIED